MPSISDSRKIINTSIPGIDGSEVELWDDVTVGDAEAIESSGGDVQKGLLTVFRLIKSWNLEEPLTLESVKCLSSAQCEHLLSQTSLYARAKKSSEEIEDETAEKKTV